MGWPRDGGRDPNLDWPGCLSWGLVRPLSSPPARPGAAGLIRSLTARLPLACPVTVLPSLPNRTGAHVRPGSEENAVATHGELRAWAMGGSGGYGAGLAAHLGERSELVIELDRPARP